MKKSQLIKIIKEEVGKVLKEGKDLTKQVFVNQFNKKAKEISLLTFPGRDDLGTMEMQEVEVSDNFINAIKRFHQLRASKQGKEEEIIQLSGNLAAIIAQSVKDNQDKGGSTTSGLTAMQSALMRHIEKLKKLPDLPEKLIVTGDTAKVKRKKYRTLGNLTLKKRQAEINAHIEQLSKDPGGTWAYHTTEFNKETKEAFLVFKKQQNIATKP